MHGKPDLLGRNGLSEAELEDLLSLDDDVLNDVYQFWTPPIRRLPPLLLVRVKNDLKQYLGNLENMMAINMVDEKNSYYQKSFVLIKVILENMILKFDIPFHSVRLKNLPS